MLYVIILITTLTKTLSHKSFETYKFTLKDTILKTGNYLVLSGGDGTIYKKSGYPAIPYYEYILPATGKVSKIEITNRKSEQYNGIYMPLPYFNKREMIERYIPDREFYSQQNLLPTKDFDVKELTIRGRKFIQLRIYPIKFNPANKSVLLTKEIFFKIYWHSQYTPSKKPFIFKNLIKGTLYTSTPSKESIEIEKGSVFDSALIWFKIPIVKSDAYKIPFSILHQNGLYATFPISEISMYSRGPDTLKSKLSDEDFYMQEIPILIKDVNSNGVFDENDYIIFYGEGPFSWRKGDTTFLPYHNPYTDTTFYWLAFGKSGKSMETLAYNPAPTIQEALGFFHYEKDETNIAWKGLLWIGEPVIRFQGSPDGEREYPFTLDQVINDTATLRIRLVGGEGIRRMVAIIGSTTLDTFIASNYFITQRTIHPFIVNNGLNSFKIKIYRLLDQDDSYGDQVFLDWYNVIYKTSTEGSSNREIFIKGNGNYTFSIGDQEGYVFNITDPLTPYLLNTYTINNKFYVHDTASEITRYFIAYDLLTPNIFLATNVGSLYSKDFNTTDMLIITSKGLIPSLWRYKSYRMSHFPTLEDSIWRWGNGNIEIIAVEDIYRDFGFGSHDPVSIRNFIYHAYTKSMNNSIPRLKFLMMVGDGTYDYRGIETMEGNIVPPYQPFETADINYYTEAKENFYSDMNDDGNPDLFYGRIPVRTSAEVAAYFNKIISYEQENTASFYRQRILLVADDERGPDGGDSEASWHVPQAEALYTSYTPPQAEKITVYETDYGTAQNYEERGRLAKIAFVNAMNAGNLIMGFYGHSNPVQMTHEMLFTINDVNLINTHSKPPLCVILTCKFGAFSRIEPKRIIAEDWVLNPNGVIGVIASPNATFAFSNGTTGRNIFGFALDGKKHPLGEITLAGNDRSYFLLGDPTIMFYYPIPDNSLEIDANNDTLRKGERSDVYILGDHFGTILTQVIGQPRTKTYYTYPNNYILSYHTTTPVLFKGSLEKIYDTAVFSFFLPVNADTGSIYVNALRTHNNVVKNATKTFQLSNGSQRPDVTGPTIKIKIRNQEVNAGETMNTPLSFNLQAEIEDSYGINLSGIGEEKGIYLIVDNTTYDLLPYFKYQTNSYTRGEVFYNVKIENEGLHDLSIVAYDNGGNRSQKTFKIYAEESTQKVNSVMIYPNPLRGNGGTYITFNIEKEAKVKLSIYTIAGTLIFESNNEYFPPGFNSIYWDGKDMFGDIPGSGLYIVMLTINTDGKKTKIRKGLFIERR